MNLSKTNAYFHDLMLALDMDKMFSFIKSDSYKLSDFFNLYSFKQKW